MLINEVNEVIKTYPSKAAFCRAVGISPQYLNQIEDGVRPIPPKAALALNEKHGVPLHLMRPEIYPVKSGETDNAA